MDVPGDRETEHARYMHPSPALCACGCGEHVEQAVHGRPREWLPGHRKQNERARLRTERALREYKEALGGEHDEPERP
jgi:hypothetical protein